MFSPLAIKRRFLFAEKDFTRGAHVESTLGGPFVGSRLKADNSLARL